MSTANLVIGDGITNKTISVSDSTPMSQRAQDATSAINTAFAVSTFKVIWGFKIVAGFNDTLIHAANLNGTATNVTSTIAAGDYADGASLAAAIQTAMQAAEDAFAGGKRVDITVTYNSGTGKFNWAWTQVRATISQFVIRGSVTYTVTALATVGIQMGSDQVGAGANGNFDGDYEVRVNRFKFAYAGLAGSVRLADVNFTAESFFGITDTTNQTIGAYLCNLDMTDPAPPAPTPDVVWDNIRRVQAREAWRAPAIRGAYAVVSKVFWGLGIEMPPNHRPSVVSTDPPHGVTGAQVGPTTILNPGPVIKSDYGPNEPTLNAVKHGMVRPEGV